MTMTKCVTGLCSQKESVETLHLSNTTQHWFHGLNLNSSLTHAYTSYHVEELATLIQTVTLSISSAATTVLLLLSLLYSR